MKNSMVRTIIYQQRAARNYNQKIHERNMKVGDLTLRRLEDIGKRVSVGKLALTWEGPFRVTKVIKLGVYKIEDLQENSESYSWNIQHLKMYFQ